MFKNFEGEIWPARVESLILFFYYFLLDNRLKTSLLFNKKKMNDEVKEEMKRNMLGNIIFVNEKN